MLLRFGNANICQEPVGETHPRAKGNSVSKHSRFVRRNACTESVLMQIMTFRQTALVCWLLQFCVPALAQRSDAFAGASECGSCHPAKQAVQRISQHALALSRPADHPLAGALAPS